MSEIKNATETKLEIKTMSELERRLAELEAIKNDRVVDYATLTAAIREAEEINHLKRLRGRQLIEAEIEQLGPEIERLEAIASEYIEAFNASRAALDMATRQCQAWETRAYSREGLTPAEIEEAGRAQTERLRQLVAMNQADAQRQAPQGAAQAAVNKRVELHRRLRATR